MHVHVGGKLWQNFKGVGDVICTLPLFNGDRNGRCRDGNGKRVRSGLPSNVKRRRTTSAITIFLPPLSPKKKDAHLSRRADRGSRGFRSHSLQIFITPSFWNSPWKETGDEASVTNAYLDRERNGVLLIHIARLTKWMTQSTKGEGSMTASVQC